MHFKGNWDKYFGPNFPTIGFEFKYLLLNIKISLLGKE